MAKNKGRRPQLHSRAWFIEHLERRLDELTDKNIEINDRLMDQYNVCAARDWPRKDVRELERLHGLLEKIGEFRARVEQDLADLYIGKKEGWPLVGEGISNYELG